MAIGTTTGTLGVLNAQVEYGITDADTVGVQVSGTWAGTITFYGSLDGTNYETFGMQTLVRANNYDQQATTTINGIFTHEGHGLQTIRVKMTSYTSGTANIYISTTRSAK